MQIFPLILLPLVLATSLAAVPGSTALVQDGAGEKDAADVKDVAGAKDDEPERPQTGPVEQVEALLQRLEGKGPADRRIAAVLLKNLSGAEYDAVLKASTRDGLGADARAAIAAALPLLKARARTAAQNKRNHQENLRTALAAYERAGTKDAKWDALAKDAITLFVKPGGPGADAAAALKKALDAGCTDPFIRCLDARARFNLASRSEQDGVLYDHMRAALDLAKTQYPADRKLAAAGSYAKVAPGRNEEIAAICMQCLPEVVADRERSNAHVFDLVERAYAAQAKVKPPMKALEDVYAIYAEGRPADDPWPHYFKGTLYVDYAWDARGNGLAHTVTEEGWQLFRARLAVAGPELTKAWELNPQDTRAPARMIAVVLGSGGSRREMEKWFKRAIEADPDNYVACQAKLNFLLPRWHGSNQEMIAFGRECAATQNWWGRTPIILVDAYQEIIRNSSPDPKALLNSPQTWRDIQSVYGSFLDAYPAAGLSPLYRSLLAKWACRCGRWSEASRLFEQIGDSPDPAVFKSKAVFDYWRRKATRNANPAPAPAQQASTG